MRLVTYLYAERRYRMGAVDKDGNIIDLNYGYHSLLEKRGEPAAGKLAQAVVPPGSLDFLESGDRAMKGAREVLDAGFPLDARSPCGKRMAFARNEVKLGAPVTNPRRIICLSHNYYDFCEETGNPVPPEPRIFSKYYNALCGPDDPIIYPKMTKALGYEVELAVIIGKAARGVSKEDAYGYIAGYTILNDVSASDLTGMDKQVLRGKTFDHFAPCGPELVTRDEVPDPNSLDVKLWVNGVELQSSNTSRLIYDVPTLVSFISRIFTLMPGDIIATGTPGGLAKDRVPNTYMQVGDVCTLEVERLGRLSNKVVPE